MIEASDTFSLSGPASAFLGQKEGDGSQRATGGFNPLRGP